MLPEGAEVAARLHHLRGILFTEWAIAAIGLALALRVIMRRLDSPAGRERALLAASLAVHVYFASSLATAVLVLHAAAVHAAIERCRGRWRALVAGALLLLIVLAPVWSIEGLGTLGPRAREYTAFATSMAALRLWAYAWDRAAKGLPRLPLSRLLLATFFFPTFVNGPLEPPHRFAAAARIDRGDVPAALGRALRGGGKLLVAGLAFPPGWTSVLASGAEAPPWQLWAWAAALWVWFYLSFSAWADVAIAAARLCGYAVPENFAAPWAARDPGEFWRRWHVSLGIWLRDYVYIPLGGNRRHRAWNVLAVFAVSAAWHVWGSLKLLGFGWFPPRAWTGFALWGLLHTGGVLAAPTLARLADRGRAPHFAGTAATFLFTALCWVPFFLPPGVSPSTCLVMLLRMVSPFSE
jgi:hypothetical protein